METFYIDMCQSNSLQEAKTACFVALTVRRVVSRRCYPDCRGEPYRAGAQSAVTAQRRHAFLQAARAALLLCSLDDGPLVRPHARLAPVGRRGSWPEFHPAR